DFALVLILAFVVGSFFGGKWVQDLNTITVKRVFAIFMIIVAVKYLFFDKPKVQEKTTTNINVEQTQ
ncbi:MAG TPA: hypothetical protein PLQ78_04555, partial [Flavipsychrobacter sp.]|nr:hypothetical protein [Flavipsychrobacter sp.]